MRQALTQARRPAADPGRDGQGHQRGAARAAQIGAQDQRDPHPAGQDRHGNRPRRQDDSRDLRSAPRSTSRTTAPSRSPRAVLASQQAVDWIRGLTSEPEVGVIYTGTVVRVVDFGAFVKFLGAHDGLLLGAATARRQGDRVVKEGDTVKVKVLSVDDRGKGQAQHARHRPGDRRGDRAGAAAAPGRRGARRRRAGGVSADRAGTGARADGERTRPHEGCLGRPRRATGQRQVRRIP